LPTGSAWLYVAVSTALALGVGLAWLGPRPSGRLRAIAWLPFAFAVSGGFPLTAREAAGTRMLCLVFAMFLALKAVVTFESRREGRAAPSPGRWLLFALLWVGMRPHLVARRRVSVRRGALREVLAGGLRVLLGVALLVAARAVSGAGWPRVAAAVLALLGLGFVVLLGLCRVAWGCWRLAAVPVGPVFSAPQRSGTLTEFWAMRWNRAFSEMVDTIVVRPVRRLLGPRAATLAAFLGSACVHEMALSVPARGGYGLPTLYFLLHGLLVRRERRPGGVTRSRARTLLLVLLPTPLVFHPPFVRACVMPLVGG
jgi:Membrane bound O-acyl transferase family